MPFWADPHVSLFLEEERAFDTIYGSLHERKLLRLGYRIIERRGIAFGKKHGKPIVPLVGFIASLKRRMMKTQRHCTYCAIKLKGPSPSKKPSIIACHYQKVESGNAIIL